MSSYELIVDGVLVYYMINSKHFLDIEQDTGIKFWYALFICCLFSNHFIKLKCPIDINQSISLKSYYASFVCRLFVDPIANLVFFSNWRKYSQKTIIVWFIHELRICRSFSAYQTFLQQYEEDTDRLLVRTVSLLHMNEMYDRLGHSPKRTKYSKEILLALSVSGFLCGLQSCYNVQSFVAKQRTHMNNKCLFLWFICSIVLN